MKKLLLLLALPLIASYAYAQSINECGFDKILQIQKQGNPNFFNELNSRNQAINDYINQHNKPNPFPKPLGGGISNSALYVIPVVVHIVRDPNDVAAVISYKQVQSQIDALNAAYSKNYPAYNGETHGPKAVNTQIQFCLAQTPMGPSGWTNAAEPGVMRYDDAVRSHSGLEVAPTNDLLSLTHPSSTYFPFNNYLNVWVVNSIDGNCSGTQGFSVFPITQHENPNSGFIIDGIVIRTDAFGDNSTGNSFSLQPHNLYSNSCPTSFAVRNEGKSLVHEVGHYLDLFHTFQPDLINPNLVCAGATPSTCMKEGDYCCDTPPSKQPGGTHRCGDPNPNSCNGQPDLIEDYMFYSFDPCWNTFTQGQTDRMQAELALYRKNLFSVTNQAITGILGPKGCLPPRAIATFSYLPGTPCVGQKITFTPLISAPANSAKVYLWNFPSGTPATSSAISPQVTYTNTGNYTATLRVTDGTTTDTYTQTVTVGGCSLDPAYIHNAQWYYGQYACIDFTSGVPVPKNTARVNKTVFSEEGTYSYSDNTGSLVFYTDGADIWNGQQVKINSTKVFPFSSQVINTVTNKYQKANGVYGIIGGSFPAHPNMYYIFCASGGEEGSGPANYVVLDLNNNTVSSLQTLPSNSPQMSEALTIAPHCNGTDYWVIASSTNTYTGGQTYSYLVTQLGVSNTPVISPTFKYNIGFYGSSIKVSPNNKLIALSGYSGSAGNNEDAALYDFNNATGVISNERLLNYTTPNYQESAGCSFSPDSKQLYTSSEYPTNAILQYDVSTQKGNVIAKPSVGLAYMQLGPDDNIYITPDGKSQFLSRIVNPNSTSAVFQKNPVDFSTLAPDGSINNVAICLPNFMDGVMPAAVPPSFTVSYTTCNTVAFAFSTCWGSGYIYTWDFGDGSIAATGGSVNHTYAPGNYTATCTLTIPGGTGNIAVTQQVNILNTTATISGPATFCVGGGSFSYGVPTLSGATYTWAVSANGSITGPANGSQINVVWNSGATGNVYVTVSDNGCIATGSLTVTSIFAITAAANPAVSSGPGSPVMLTATGPATATYTWTDGTNTYNGNPVTVYPTVATTYTVQAVDNTGCRVTATVTVGINTVVCGNTYTSNVISTPTNWTASTFPGGKVYIAGTLVVKRAQRLTINAGVVVSFGPKGKIVLEGGSQGARQTGGSLVVDGATLQGCSSMWQGIEAYSVSYQYHSTLILKNNATIQDAHIAVYAASSNPNDVTHVSIAASGSTFKSNAVGVRIKDYYTAAVNLNGCTFQGGTLLDPKYTTGNATGTYPSAGQPTLAVGTTQYAQANLAGRSCIAIDLSEVYLLSNAFNVITINNTEIGINGFDEDNGIVNCNFKNLRIGYKTYALPGRETHYSAFNLNTFTDIDTCLRIENATGFGFANNTLIKQGTTQAGLGLYTSNSSGFNVIDNSYTNFKYGAVIDNSYNSSYNQGGTLGATSNNGGNQFTNCYEGLHTQKDNHLLQIKCSQFNNNTAVTNYNKNWYSVDQLADQGTYNAADATNTQNPAGDRFENTNRQELQAFIPSPGFIYYRHNDPLSPPNFVNPNAQGFGITVFKTAAQFDATSCTPFNSCPTCIIINTRHTLDSLQRVYVGQVATLDKGLTQLLNGLIGSPTIGPGGSNTLLTMLMNASPLSDQVLTNLINHSVGSAGTIPSNVLQQVMVFNSPVSGTVSALLQSSRPLLPAPVVQAIEAVQVVNPAGVGTLTDITRQIDFITNFHTTLLNQQLTELMRVQNINRAIQLLEAEGNPSADRKLISFYLQQAKITASIIDTVPVPNPVWIVKARAKLAALPANTPELKAVNTLTAMAIHNVANNQSWFNMTASQEQYIGSVASQFPRTLPGSMAKAILEMVKGEQHPVYIDYNIPINNNRKGAWESSTGISTGENSPALGNNIPNPFDQNTLIPYYLPKGSGRAYLKITDLMGRVLKTYELNEGQQVLTVDAVDLQSGVYLYGMELNGAVVAYKRMVLTH